MVRDARKFKAQEKAAGEGNIGQSIVSQHLSGPAYDGAPGSVSDSRGRPPSSSGLPSVGQPGHSRSRAPSPMSAAFPIQRRDPAREESRYETMINTRLDLPGNAYALINHVSGDCAFSYCQPRCCVTGGVDSEAEHHSQSDEIIHRPTFPKQ